MTPATALQRNDIISRWTADCLLSGTETVEDSELRRVNLMDALDDVPPDILNEAFKRARRLKNFVPAISDVYDHAGPMMRDRLIDMRIERDRLAVVTRQALPAPVYVDAADTAQILADCFAKLNKGYQRMEGRPMPGARQQREAVPRNVSTALRMPTQADLQAIADDLDNKPRRERMTFTKADCVSLGIDPARVA
jgi:hypothetical protein